MNSTEFISGFFDALDQAKKKGVKMESLFCEEEDSEGQIDSYKLSKDNYFVGDLFNVINSNPKDTEDNFFGFAGKGIYKEKSFVQVPTGGDSSFENLCGYSSEGQIVVDSGSMGIIPIDQIDIEPIELAKLIKLKIGFLYQADHDLNVDHAWGLGIHIYPDTNEYVRKDSIMIPFFEAYVNAPDSNEPELTPKFIENFLDIAPSFATDQNSSRSFNIRTSLLNRKAVREWWCERNKKRRVLKKKASWMQKKYGTKMGVPHLCES